MTQQKPITDLTAYARQLRRQRQNAIKANQLDSGVGLGYTTPVRTPRTPPQEPAIESNPTLPEETPPPLPEPEAVPDAEVLSVDPDITEHLESPPAEVESVQDVESPPSILREKVYEAGLLPEYQSFADKLEKAMAWQAAIIPETSLIHPGIRNMGLDADRFTILAIHARVVLGYESRKIMGTQLIEPERSRRFYACINGLADKLRQG